MRNQDKPLSSWNKRRAPGSHLGFASSADLLEPCLVAVFVTVDPRFGVIGSVKARTEAPRKNSACFGRARMMTLDAASGSQAPHRRRSLLLPADTLRSGHAPFCQVSPRRADRPAPSRHPASTASSARKLARTGITHPAAHCRYRGPLSQFRQRPAQAGA